ncbi:glycosyl transferase family 1 [Vibrio sinaloensis]|uniref:glycosyltransferase family 4 protein n=1 Tax=Photobacterium sp. (strain ATCC 43367) TaxID=379097 RepID=UPI00057E4C7B|nr:glycosyltransferase family 4 protein [Vibrio sinaloensis]KIE19442.1 glycosyl transferase family 1 [Vibrio sinaloensis]
MKILYIHQYFATPDSNAGTRSYEMAKRLIANGNKVLFITSSAYLSNREDLIKGWNYINIEGIELYVLHLPYSNKDGFIKRIIKFINFSISSSIKSMTLNGFDVVFATSTPLTIAIPALLYSKIKKVPMVFEVRDLWPELPVAVGAIKNRVLIKTLQLFERYVYHNSKKLIGLSPGMCEGIERVGVDKKNITLSTNSCDTDLFDVSLNVGLDYKRTNLPFLNGRKLIVYTGTFGVINNVHYLVDLAKEMLLIDNDVCFVAIGDGMQKQAVISYSKQVNVYNNNLFFLDPVPKKEVVKLLSAADLSISLFGPVKEMWNNSANKLFDALASKTPIAINYEGWQKDLIDNENCGVVLDSSNFSLSAKRLSEFLRDKKRYTLAVSSCSYLAYNRYSRDIMAKRLEKTLVEAVND